MNERFIVVQSVADMFEVFDTKNKETVFVNEDMQLCDRVAERKNKKSVDNQLDN